MAEKKWERGVTYAAVIAVAGVTYYLAQTAIDRNRADLAVTQYIDCIFRVSTIDWSKYSGDKPSASEVCKELTSRQKRN